LALGGLFVVGPSAEWPAQTLNRRANGQIALAGPAASLIVATLFFAALSLIILGRVATPAWFPYFGYVGFRLNAMLGLCSLAPLGRFDGAKVLAWNRAVFVGAAAAGLILTFALGNENVLQRLLRVVTSLEG
jgi:Zn-dependent protease